MIQSLQRLTGFLTRSSGERETEPDTADDWPYEWTETAVEKVHGEPVISHAAADDPESVFAGPLARAMLEGPRHDPDQPLYIGLGTRRGRHVGIERQFLFRHTCVFGTTGYGKSTLLKNAAKQVIESGHGCCFLDPKGQDSIELMQIIPDDRLDDVVWIEPGQNRSAVAGFNFLEVGVDEDNPMYDTAVENVVGDLRRMVGADDYWGPLMDGVCSNLIRGTTRLEEDFNLLDLYYLLVDADARAQYARMLEGEGLTFLADYAHKIEEMDDDDLDALQRRFKDWVEDPLARSTVAHRDTDIDIESIVNEDKILIVRMAEQTEELKMMIGTAILRRIWSAIRSRAATYDTEYDPFYLFADEFDLIASQDSSVTTMLSKARSLSLALFLCCQQPSQLPDGVVSAMYSNCDTCLSFSPGSPANARAVAKNLDMDPATLRHESNFHVWTQLTLSSTRERSEAFRTYTLPPCPPVRSLGETMHAIERTVRALGRAPLSDDEMRRGLILGGDGADFDLMAGGGQRESESGLEMTEAVERATVAAVYDTAIRQGDPGGWVTLDQAVPAIRRRVGRLADTPPGTSDRLDSTGDIWRRVGQHVRDDWLDVRGSDPTELRVPTPRQALATVGQNQSAGGAGHAMLIWEAYVPLTRAGLEISISEASGTDPDGLARPVPADEQADPELVDRLLGDRDEARVEAESATVTKPGSTIRHLNQAREEQRAAILLVRPDDADAVRETVFGDPPGYRSGHDTDGERRLYTSPRDLRIGDETFEIPGRESVWVETDDGEAILRDDSGTEQARFECANAIFTDADRYPSAGGTTVKRPVVPAYDTEDVTLVEVPEETTAVADLTIEDDTPAVPEHTEPLVALLTPGESISKPEAQTRLADHDHDVSRATVHRWMTALVDAGVLHETDETTATGAAVFHVTARVLDPPDPAA